MPDNTNKLLESRLVAELSSLNRKIADLELEKRGLERLLVRVRREEVANKEVGRKNSAKRVLVEQAVMKRLTDAEGRSVASSDLWRAANDVELHLNQATFRSYLHRMKIKGLIESAHLSGRWKLPNTPSDGVHSITEQREPSETAGVNRGEVKNACDKRTDTETSG